MSIWYLYLDESSDLGFDFVSRRPTKFFTIAILVIQSHELDRKLAKQVKVVLRRKLNPPGKRSRLVEELKGNNTTFEIKKYFFQRIKDIPLGIYAMTLNKRRVFEQLAKDKSRVYNFIARKVLDHIPFEKNDAQRVQLVVDRSKSKPEIEDFNRYISQQLKGRLNPKTPLAMHHWKSNESHGLQAADMFCWGIFQKYERKNEDWLNVFKEKIVFENQYL